MSKVVVAMSGGVDSSVAVALLKQQGHDVIGMMLRLWSEPGKEDSNRCCTPDSMAMARRVASKLDVPFYVVDAKEVFRKTVVQYFFDGYAAGLTPNPCLLCNRQIRWTFLLKHALARQSISQVVLCLRIVRFESDCFKVVVNGSINMPLSCQSKTQVIMGLREIGLIPQSGREMGDGLLNLSPLEQSKSKVVVAVHKVGFDAEGGGIMSDCFLDFTLLGQSIS